MQIAVLGAGNVGGALARLWTEAGHQVQTVTRKNSPTAAEGAADAEVIALCVPGHTVEDALVSCGNVSGKIVIDCTNPIAPGLEGLLYGGTTSAAERLQQLRPDAHIVKAFNSLGASLLGIGPPNGESPADGFFCGDDPAAKSAVGQLVADARLRPVDVGSLRNARYLEAMAMLWIDLAVKQGRGVSFTFNLVPQNP